VRLVCYANYVGQTHAKPTLTKNYLETKMNYSWKGKKL